MLFMSSFILFELDALTNSNWMKLFVLVSLFIVYLRKKYNNRNMKLIEFSKSAIIINNLLKNKVQFKIKLFIENIFI
jgi:hypothetical protein